MEHAKLVIVHSYGSRAEAHLARGALEDAGIPAMIQGDAVGGMREHLAWSGSGFQVLVREEDAMAAREILTPIPDGDDDPESQNPPPWRQFT